VTRVGSLVQSMWRDPITGLHSYGIIIGIEHCSSTCVPPRIFVYTVMMNEEQFKLFDHEFDVCLT